MTAYGDLLRDPRWQRKRLEVMERAEFECEECGSKTKTLNVHHAYYEKGCDPWEYPNDSLRCLCEDCHERVEAELREIRKLAGIAWRAARANILGYIRAAAVTSGSGAIVPLESAYIACGMGHFFDLTTAEVWDRRGSDGTVNLVRLWEAMIDKEAAKVPTS